MDQSLFVYDTYILSSDRKHVDFTFTTHKQEETFNFTESYEFAKALPECLETHRLLKMLHLASGISYYKLFFNTEIEHPYAMSTKESGFWNEVFKNGLGEFMYVNKLLAEKLAVFSPQEGHDTPSSVRTQLSQKALLGIGGGKDSIVAGELLKSIHLPVDGFVLATGDATAQAAAVAKTMKVNSHIVNRTIDKSLLQLQSRQDAYKGHIPISLIFAIVGSLLAVVNNASYVVVANESSASIPRVHYEGSPVNHQWSKSFEAENLIQQYLHEFVHPDLWYFSAIRPLTSVAVAKIFSSYPKYFEVFTSDNFGFRVQEDQRPDTRWSLQSPKSLSSFILLSAWLDEKQLTKIFGQNLLDISDLEPMFLQLTGLQGEQPLDCVGTPQELRASLVQTYQRGLFKDTKLMLLAEQKGIVAIDRVIAPTVEQLLPPKTENAFPPSLAQSLQTKLTEAIA